VCVCVCVFLLIGSVEIHNRLATCCVQTLANVVNEIFVLQGRYAAYIGTWIRTFWDNLSVESLKVKHSSWNSLTLQDGAERLSQNVSKQVII
jgi:hypothetical protein